MPISDATTDLLRDLARRPANHDKVKADFRELLIREFGLDRGALDFEVRAPVIAGRLDALVGRTVFEAKRDLAGEWSDVERRMPDYLADREREYGEPFVGIASDGLKWVALELRDGALTRLTETTLDPDKGETFLAWLDGVLALKASLPPDPLTVRAELGQDSVAYARVLRELRALWSQVSAHPAEALKRQLWADLLKQVYGREVESDALWFQHSYLVIVAKCIALAVMDLPEDDPRRMLSGEAFSAASIQGAVESDFFDWPVALPEGEALVRRIMAHVRRFRLREVESDVLKVLYESLIDRDERHGLGEYYTPDWLAAKIVRHAVNDPLVQKVLDPACGSGTFLFHAIRRFIAEAEDSGMDQAVRAAEACDHVQGTDIHPVAVIIARVTYLLALAPALAGRSGALSIPVYLGDAMQLSISQVMTGKELVINVPPPPAGAGTREKLSFPDTFCRDPALFDKAIQTISDASLQNRTREQVEVALTRVTDTHIKLLPADAGKRLARREAPELTDEHRRAIADLGVTYETFHRLRLQGRDTIWAYVARNLSRPLALASGGGWANVLVGNPPWVAFRHMSTDLQKRFKALANGEGVFVGGKFATQNDLSALFTVRASHLYLRPSGKLAFVLPLAAMSRGQFEKFRAGRFTSYNVAWDEAWTMDDSVAPLFPVPSCVVFGRKRAIAQKMPDKVLAYSGWLPMRDAPEAIADARLGEPQPGPAPSVGEFEGGSPYRSLFRNGASLFPRMLCLVERRTLGRLGADPAAPAVASRRGAQDKDPWKSVPILEGQIESDFLRPVLLGESILPYRLLQAFEGVVPVTSTGEMLNASGAADHNPAYKKLADWLKAAEAVWIKHSSGKLTLSGRFDYHRELSSQFPLPSLRVVYAKAGSQPAACVIRDSKAIIDHMLYWAKPDSEEEAHYLCAIINSETVRKRAEAYQARGQFGARHFDKVVWNLPIPRFDAKLALHRELATLGSEAERIAEVVELIETEKFQRARQRVRRALIADGVAVEIEKAVEKLLDSGDGG